MIRRLLVPLAVLVAAAVAVAGCGAGAGAGGGSDPAAVVPADALLYADATLRPEGDARDGALAAAGKVLRTDDPAARSRQLVDEALAADGEHIDFARDIDPWLGDRAALWLDAKPAGGGEPNGAAVVAVRDEDAARSKIEELARRDGKRLSERSAGGVDYEVDGDGDARAIHDGWLIAGEENAVRRALTLGDGGALADSDAYRDATDGLSDDRLATYYLDTGRLFDAALAAGEAPAEDAEAFRSLVDVDALRPVAGAFTADGDRLALDSIARVEGGGTLGGLGGALTAPAPPLMRELPGDSWAALGIPRLGETLRTVLGRVTGAIGGIVAESQLRRELGIDLDRDLLSWMGDAAVFVRGTTPDTVGGGLVVQVTDEERAADAFGKLVGLARTQGGLDPQPVRVPGADAAFDLGAEGGELPAILARGHGRMVLAYGPGAAAAALSPSRRLEDAAVYDEARDALDGMDPSLLVSMPAVVSLAEASSGGDPDFRRAKPYLDAFSVVASAAERDGDELRSRVVAGLR